MNKKLLNLALMATCLTSGVLYAATEKQVYEHIKSFFPVDANVSVKMLSTNELKDASPIKVHVFELSDKSGQKVREIAFSHGDYIFAEMFNMKSKESLKQKIETQEVIKTIKPLLSKEDPKNIVQLGSDRKKETMVVFTDPECPYCRAELKKVEELLKTYNLKFVFTSVHEESAVKKIAYILDEVTPKMTGAQKIAVLRKHYDERALAETVVPQNRIDELNALKAKYFATGIKGVPFIFIDKN